MSPLPDARFCRTLTVLRTTATFAIAPETNPSVAGGGGEVGARDLTQQLQQALDATGEQLTRLVEGCSAEGACRFSLELWIARIYDISRGLRVRPLPPAWPLSQAALYRGVAYGAVVGSTDGPRAA